MNTTLFPFLAEAVSPWHATEALARRLAQAGFHEVTETDAWTLKPGSGYFFRRGGSALAAFVVGTDPTAGWKVAAAHTDSPGWRLKLAQQKVHASGVTKIGTEVYGSPIHSTWFDRPLAIVGRVFVKGPTGPQQLLVRTEALGLFRREESAEMTGWPLWPSAAVVCAIGLFCMVALLIRTWDSLRIGRVL